MFQFDLKRIRDRQESTLLVVDMAMLVLLIVNLAWLIFDWLFSSAWFGGLVGQLSPAFHHWYATTIAPNFWHYDLAFVAIFLTEFLLRWVLSVRRGTYLRWYFYPFLHWYELLGCIPIVGFRMLRSLRVISMLVRLNRLGVIQLQNTAPGRFVRTWIDVFMEEVSDRVVLNMLDRVQDELGSGQPLTHRIIDDVVLARRQELVEEIGFKVDDILRGHYDLNRDAIHDYIDARIRSAVEQSEDVGRLGRIPVFGGTATGMLERSISDIVRHLVDTGVADLRSSDNRQIIEDIVHAIIDVLVDQGDGLHSTTNDMLIEAIDILKDRIRVQRWRGPMEAELRARRERRRPASPRPSTNQDPSEAADGIASESR